MKALNALELLDVWEQGLGSPPSVGVMLLLAAACPDVNAASLAELTIGERDGLLLTQREWLFGPQLESVVACPHCGEQLELAFAVDDVRAVPTLTHAAALGQPHQESLEMAGYTVQFRVPTVVDLSADITRQQLFERCVVAALYAGEAYAAQDLPAAVVEAVGQQMLAADPQADVQLALNCPACGHDWLAVFDVVSFLWQEINAWAQRTLLEVHQLARAYGWSEANILAMSPLRRQVYLSMIGAA